MNIIGKYIQLSLKESLEYRANAVAICIDTVLDVLTVWLFWASLLELEIALVHWEKEQLILFMGFSLIYKSVLTLFAKAWNVQDSILRGTLDGYLVRPCNAVLMIMLENANFLRCFLTLAIGLLMLLAGGKGYEPVGMAVAVLMSLAASFAVNLILLLVYELCFFFQRMDSVADIVSSVFSVADYPLIFFHNPLLFVFTYLIPIAFIGTIPVEFLLGRCGILQGLWIFVLLGLIACCNMLIWRWGRRHYESVN